MWYLWLGLDPSADQDDILVEPLELVHPGVEQAGGGGRKTGMPWITVDKDGDYAVIYLLPLRIV